MLAAHLFLALAGDPAERPFFTLGVLAFAFGGWVWAARRLEATAQVPLILLIAIISLVSKIVPEEIVTPPEVMKSTVDNNHIAAISAAIHLYKKNR